VCEKTRVSSGLAADRSHGTADVLGGRFQIAARGDERTDFKTSAVVDEPRAAFGVGRGNMGGRC
jgi:hypothetical protein